MDRTVFLKVSTLHKRFGTDDRPVDVLGGISFEVSTGEALAIVGPSGSGKSTLLHIIGTLDHPTSGQVEIEGADPFSLKESELARFRNRVVGFVFQHHHLLPQYSALENVLMPTLAFGSAGPEQVEKAHYLLHRVGLSDRLEHRPAELSGGECQRAAVARSLINSPRLLLCDEPTGSLDHASAEAVATLLFELHADEGLTMMAVTHNAELSSRFARRLELREGKCSEV